MNLNSCSFHTGNGDMVDAIQFHGVLLAFDGESVEAHRIPVDFDFNSFETSATTVWSERDVLNQCDIPVTKNQGAGISCSSNLNHVDSVEQISPDVVRVFHSNNVVDVMLADNVTFLFPYNIQ